MNNSKRKYKELTNNTLLFTISNFGSKIISFLLVPLYTNVLSTSDYGSVDLVSTTVQLLLPLLTLNIQDAVLRFALDKEQDEKDVISNGLKVISIGSFALFVVLSVCIVFKPFQINSIYLIFLFLNFLFMSLNNTFSMYLRSMNRVKIIVIAGLANTFLACVLNILFLLVLKWGVTGFFVANLMGVVVSVIIMLMLGNIRKEIIYKTSNVTLRAMVAFSTPLILNSLAWWLNNASDRYILSFFCGAAVNGVYAVAYKIPTILSTVQGVFYNAWTVSAIKEFDKNDTDGFVGNIFSLYNCISIISCSVLLLMNPILARLLYAKEFYAAWRYVPMLLVGSVFNGLALFEGCIFTAVKQTKEVSKTTLIGAAVNTLLNVALIPIIGAMGAAIATMIGYLSVTIIRTISTNKIVKMKLSWPIHIISVVLILIQGVVATFESTTVIQILIFLLIFYVQKSFIGKVFLKVATIVTNRLKNRN